MTRWWLLLAGVALGLGYALLTYGWLPTLITAAVVTFIAVVGFIVRAVTRANRHIDQVLREELGPDTNGETR